MKKIFILAAVLCFNFGCSVSIEPDKTPEQAAPTESIQLTKGETFNVHIEGLSQPNLFQARIIFRGDLSRGYIIQKTSRDQKVSTFSLDHSYELIDNDLKPSETYSYAIGLVRNGKFIQASTVDIEVQPDFIIDGILSNSNTTPLDLKNKFRLYFKKNSTLKSLGRDLEIDVQEIFSENGNLQTFSLDDSAPIYQAGAPSGRIIFKARKITGPFTIEIRGQKGGQGHKGAVGATGIQGPPSPRNILDVGFGLLTIMPDLCARQYYAPGNGRPCGNESYDECLKKHMGIGGKGGPGGQGFQGSMGLKGGDAENAILEIPQPHENIKIIFEAGRGGSGGESGDGGPGGPGGPGAPLVNNSPGRPCDSSPSGPTGDQGINGPIGPEGVAGNKGLLSINGVLQ